MRSPAPNLEFETGLWQVGVVHVAGIDEAGRGALAGPVSAAAVILPSRPNVLQALSGVRDSKQMTPAQRDYWRSQIIHIAAGWGVGFASAAEIDLLGILPATRLAAMRALAGLGSLPGHLILDFLFLPDSALPQTSLVKGDQRSLSVAAASVLAKTARDAELVALDAQMPGYGFARHKGYGTAAHYAALMRLGPSAVHRKSFRLRASLQPVSLPKDRCHSQ